MEDKQLYEKIGNEYKEFVPIANILSIIDKSTGMSAKDLFNTFNHIKLEWKGDVTNTRLSVPIQLRHNGLYITYNDGNGIITEYYIGSSMNAAANSVWQKDEYWLNISQAAGLADEEDITERNSKLSFKDREYKPSNFSGLGRIILRKNLTEVGTSVKNVLTQEMINKENTIYEIRYDFDLNGQEIAIPENCVLDFQGGSLDNGTIIGFNSLIKSFDRQIFKDNLSIKGVYNNEHFNVLWFGAIPNYDAQTKSGFDNYQAITLANKACSNTSKPLYIPSGNYFYTEPLIIEGTYNYISDGILYYNGGYNIALTIGSPDMFITSKEYKIKVDQVNKYEYSSSEYNVGVLIYNIYQSKINLDYISNFVYNAVLCANNSGFAYNTINIGCIANHYKGLILYSKDDGWVNENLFLGGRFTVSSSDIFKESCIGVSLDSNYAYRCNNNVFIKPSIEGHYTSVECVYGRQNTFLSIRCEGVSIALDEKNNSYYNVLLPGYVNNSGIIHKKESVHIGSFVEPIYTYGIYSTYRHLVYNSGNAKYAIDADGNLTTPNIPIVSSSNLHNRLLYFKSNIHENGGIKLNSSISVAIEIDNMGKNNTYCIELLGEARKGFICYDKDGNNITSSENIKSQSGHNLNESSLGGETIFIKETNTKNSNTFITLSSNVHKFKVIFKYASEGYIKNISIYSLLNAKLITNNIVPTLPSVPTEYENVSEVVSTNINIKLWKLVNDEWIANYFPKIAEYDLISLFRGNNNLSSFKYLGIASSTGHFREEVEHSYMFLENGYINMNTTRSIYLLLDVSKEKQFIINVENDTSYVEDDTIYRWRGYIQPLNETKDLLDIDEYGVEAYSDDLYKKAIGTNYDNKSLETTIKKQGSAKYEVLHDSIKYVRVIINTRRAKKITVSSPSGLVTVINPVETPSLDSAPIYGNEFKTGEFVNSINSDTSIVGWLYSNKVWKEIRLNN